MAFKECKKISLYKYEDKIITATEMTVSSEYPLLIIINGTPFVTIAFSGGDPFELIAGHLFTEGLIQKKEEILSFDLDEQKFQVNITLSKKNSTEAILSKTKQIVTAGGRAKNTLPPPNLIRKKLPEIHAKTINQAMNTFLESSPLREKTYGVHSSALLDFNGNEIVFFDEIGRHNAIDKVIGYAILNNITLRDKLILSTGRISSEIVMKIIWAEIPIFCSRASPTTYSVELLQKYNIISLCRARENKFHIINGKKQILLD